MVTDMTDEKTTIADLKKEITEFCSDRDWDQFHNQKDLAIGIANNLVFLAVLAALAVVVVRAVRKKKPLGRLGKKKSKLPAGEEPKSEE